MNSSCEFTLPLGLKDKEGRLHKNWITQGCNRRG